MKLAAQVSNPLQPANAAERNRLLVEAIKPVHVGCQHLKGMLTTPASYGVRKDMVEWIIQSYLNVYYDPHNPLRHVDTHVALVGHPTYNNTGWLHIVPHVCLVFRTVLLYVVSPGAPTKAAGHAKIYSPDYCPG